MMEIVVAVVILFTLVQLTVALINLTGIPRLPAASVTLLSQVSVLIPARNEAANLPHLLDSLLQLPVSPLEILICDDHSSDATFSIASRIALHHSHIRVFHSALLPSGWQGKNFACYQLAQQARGKYFLFLDADVQINKTDIQRTIYRMQESKTGLLSVFPRQIMLTTGEKTTVPLMTYILLTLLPLPLVYAIESQKALAAANGQYMLFDATIYQKLQPHREVKHEVTEDIAISRYYKSRQQRVECLTGIAGITCRMYHSHSEAIKGFSRNITAFFGNSMGLAVLFWLLTSAGWIPIAFYLSWAGLLTYLLLRLTIRMIVALTCRQSVTDNLVTSVAQQVNLFVILSKSFCSRRRRQQEWKGRNILQ